MDIPLSSSSSSSDLHQENEEIDNVIGTINRNYVPILVSALTPTTRRGVRNEQRSDRDREGGHVRLYYDYFAERPVYGRTIFQRRFRMQKHVFKRIMNGVVANDHWFQQRRDATGRLGLSPLQKCTAAIRQLAYGVAADACDEYIRLSSTTARLALYKFTKGVINAFSDEYLRRSNQADLERLIRIGNDRGFPGCIGSIDCMHWEWKDCSTAWKGHYQGRDAVATIVLEAIADQDTWICHSFFGMPGSCNDINILHRSPVFEDVLHGRAPEVNFLVNDNEYNKGYYFTDGIYPKWSTFVKSITSPQTRKYQLFAQVQESARKDVERAFGVLQARFAVVRRPALAWDLNSLNNIMLSCIIMHKMIVEDERNTYENFEPITELVDDTFEVNNDQIVDINLYLQHKQDIEDQHVHLSLKNDLVEHIWQQFGRNGN